MADPIERSGGGDFMIGTKKLIGAVAALIALAAPTVVHATYNANIAGVINNLRVYDDGLVLFTLTTQPTSHPACNANYFALEKTMDPNFKAMLLSRALVAKSSGETIKIGYDNAGSCANNYIRVHMIGE